jgi:NAD(P)-dependent dehydrogenase (short-subunit alcohol dehydrogenase family)
MDFHDQVAIVTGAAGNFGAAIARELAAGGAKLALVDVNGEALKAVAAGLPESAAPLLLDGIDLRRAADAERVADETMARFNRIDALANTVGTFRMGAIADDAVDQFSFLMELNALSALLISRAVAPIMAAQHYGRVLHVAAGAAQRAGASMAAYGASKAALMRITESLSEEYKRQGVTANCIQPSVIDTPQNRAAMPDADFSDWVPPEALAKVAAFLLSRESWPITGAVVPAPGRN